jgi:hypothetical protein
VPAIAFAADYDSENQELESIVIPDTVKTISEGAFCNCTSLTNVVIPESVTSIGEAAFVGCKSLTSIVIPESVTSIGNSAFDWAGAGDDEEGILTIKGYAGSYAETYAKEKGIPFEEIDEEIK